MGLLEYSQIRRENKKGLDNTFALVLQTLSDVFSMNLKKHTKTIHLVLKLVTAIVKLFY